jgi:hypothetical protein
MKMRTRTALALSGGAAALVLAVGGGVMTAPPAHQPLPPDPSTLPHPAGTGVHIGSLTGCIGGLNC